MRRVVGLILLCLALPLAASANSIDIATNGGTLSDSSNGLSLGGDVITSYAGITGNLGTVTFTTGAFATGGVSGGTFGPGGTFTITGNGSMGVPNGVIFSGTFTSGTWTHQASGAYVFVGDVKSTSGAAVGSFTEVTFVGTLNPNGSISVASGDIVISTVPEPGTLGLLGTGLLGIGGVVRKRFLR